MALDVNSKTFVIYLAIKEQKKMPIQVAALIFNKTPIVFLGEYPDYNNVFSAKNAAKISENIGMNEHSIELEEDK